MFIVSPTKCYLYVINYKTYNIYTNIIDQYFQTLPSASEDCSASAVSELYVFAPTIPGHWDFATMTVLLLILPFHEMSPVG